MAKRPKLPVLIVGIVGHPMFTVLPFNTISQRNKAYNELKKRGIITLPAEGGELKVLQIRTISTAVIADQHTFKSMVVPEKKSEEKTKKDDNKKADVDSESLGDKTSKRDEARSDIPTEQERSGDVHGRSNTHTKSERKTKTQSKEK